MLDEMHAYMFILQIDSVPKHLTAEFNLGCLNTDIDHTYRVYVTTFLGNQQFVFTLSLFQLFKCVSTLNICLPVKIDTRYSLQHVC